ncbi:hypothetical protein [Hymenobacter crusticola]|uniref:Uncharacterized protein n=1 Tax=Hymenobacter crusticola TaxID=1770526 RepID=A0A243W6R0_9BACT|nr:hypothetical protein [Hymenobacter crusticola]OUJ69879.1 hypothetical protein BXP70_25775 [Hymenobacter crusticola]
MNKTKKPLLTSLMRPAPTLSPEEQQRIQAENNAKLFGLPTDTPITSAPTPEPAPAMWVPSGQWVQFGTYIKDHTYLQLKQAEYFEPGFEIREFVEEALKAALAELDSAQKSLPVNAMEKLLKTNKKLGRQQQ